MVEGCTVKSRGVKDLEKSQRLRDNKTILVGNLSINSEILGIEYGRGHKRVLRQLNVESNGGRIFTMPVVKQFVTVCKHSCPDLYKNE